MVVDCSVQTVDDSDDLTPSMNNYEDRLESQKCSGNEEREREVRQTEFIEDSNWQAEQAWGQSEIRFGIINEEGGRETDLMQFENGELVANEIWKEENLSVTGEDYLGITAGQNESDVHTNVAVEDDLASTDTVGLQKERGGIDKDRSNTSEEEETSLEECPFCMYMKGGACGDSFTKWEECTEEAEREGVNIVEKCARVTRILTQCMRANADYYGPLLQAEKAIGGVGVGDDLKLASENKQQQKEAFEVETTAAAEEGNK